MNPEKQNNLEIVTGTSLIMVLALLAVSVPSRGWAADVIEVESDIGTDQIKPDKSYLEDQADTKKDEAASMTDVKESPVAAMEMPGATETLPTKDILTGEDVIDLNRSLRRLIEENDRLKKEKTDIDKQLKNLRGQMRIDSSRRDDVIMQRDAYKLQSEKFLESNQEFEKRLADLQAEKARREAELLGFIEGLQNELAAKTEEAAALKTAEETAAQETPPGSSAKKKNSRSDDRAALKAYKEKEIQMVKHIAELENEVAQLNARKVSGAEVIQLPPQGALQTGNIKDAGRKKPISVEISAGPDEAFNGIGEARGEKVVETMEEMRREKARLRKDAAKVHYNMGNNYFSQGDYKRAVQEYRETLKLMPQDANAHYNLAFVSAEYLNDPATAYRHYQQYLYLNPRAEDANEVKQKIFEAELSVRTTLDSDLEQDLQKEMNTVYDYKDKF